MIFVTTDTVPDQEVVEVLGMVSGWVRDGFISSKILEEAKEKAQKEAEKMDATAIVGCAVTFSGGCLCFYGTAVRTASGSRVRKV